MLTDVVDVPDKFSPFLLLNNLRFPNDIQKNVMHSDLDVSLGILELIINNLKIVRNINIQTLFFNNTFMINLCLNSKATIVIIFSFERTPVLVSFKK
ncbi:hypothetical protein HMPREF2861_11010 [Lactobacillus sp. HMSC068F07]|nr:hypothetical protein HMPREF2861_11010 [Lactobacillus sp. HMSC068F07]